MVKSKLAQTSKGQRCKFLIGPNSTWLMPNTSDIWTQPKNNKPIQDDSMDIEQFSCDDDSNLSYFIYGAKGCFCYGEIYHPSTEQKYSSQPKLTALVNRLVEVKEDNSRVSCVRFLKASSYPIAMVLSENGSLLIHDCISYKSIVHLRKTELINKLLGPLSCHEDDTSGEHFSKKPKFNVSQQINACLWPDPRNAFLGISLLRENTVLLLWLKLKDLTDRQLSQESKAEFIESFEKLNLSLAQYSSPICCMESAQLDSKTHLIAVGLDEGIITVVRVNLEEGQSKRVIKLHRHDDAIRSMSFYLGNTQKYQLGFLASVSKKGMVLLWDIDNQYNFAEYQVLSRSTARINWFALSFIQSKKINAGKASTDHAQLVISNSESGLTVLKLADPTKTKVTLKKSKEKTQDLLQGYEKVSPHHDKVIFNVIHDLLTETVMTTSLDGNIIFWTCRHTVDDTPSSVVPEYLFPSMPGNSRTHMLRHNPINEALLGMALGKAGVRFYHIGANPKDHNFEMNQNCKAITRKIEKASLSPASLSWHPRHEYRLAIGTLEGKVLQVDLFTRQGTLLEAEHYPLHGQVDPKDDIFDVGYQPISREDSNMNQDGCDDTNSGQSETGGVYSVCWGPDPMCPKNLDRLVVYAVGSNSHRLFIYHHKKDFEKLTNILDEFWDTSLPEASSEASEVAWKSSMDLMALGLVSGKIIIARCRDTFKTNKEGQTQLFQKLTVIKAPCESAFIQCLAWHPTTNLDDPLYHYIAVSAKDSACYIFNIKENILVADVKSSLKIEEKGQTDDTALNILTSYLFKLEAHKKTISDIAWSPHNPNELATASFDRHCYVWSLEDKSDLSGQDQQNRHVISKFATRDRLFTLEWSLVDPDLIYSSGNDCTVWAWRPTENSVLL